MTNPSTMFFLRFDARARAYFPQCACLFSHRGNCALSLRPHSSHCRLSYSPLCLLMNDGHSGRTYLASRHVTVRIASSGWRDRGKITKDFGKVSASHLSRKKQTEWDQAMAEHAREELRGAPLTLFFCTMFLSSPCRSFISKQTLNR